MVNNLKFIRPQSKELRLRLHEPRRFLQVVTGSRQVGKTTLVTQTVSKLKQPYHFASADEPTLRHIEWIEAQWNTARLLTKESKQKKALLILDEIQKIPNWAEMVKKLWDEDSRHKRSLKVILLGSAPLLVGQGLMESLAGRFETLHLPHWSFSEMKKAFNWTLDQYLFYGAYPGAAPLIKNWGRWSGYIRNSLIETTIARDVLLLSRVDKPALLRRLFELGCVYSGQILSYTKMLGQLQGAGNATTLAHYLNLLEGAGMLVGLQKYAGSTARRRGSSPKMQILNTALMTALSGQNITSAQSDREFWGRLVESAVGAHLVNGSVKGSYEVFYWRDRNQEVDFVVYGEKKLTAIEVKSQRSRGLFSGMKAFSSTFHPTRKLIVGGNGIAIQTFLLKPPEHWVL